MDDRKELIERIEELEQEARRNANVIRIQTELIETYKTQVAILKEEEMPTLDCTKTHTWVDHAAPLRVINNAVRMPIVLVDPETSRVFEVSMWRPEIRQGQLVSVVMQANVLMPNEDFDE